jgi:hypothetical protein
MEEQNQKVGRTENGEPRKKLSGMTKKKKKKKQTN